MPTISIRAKIPSITFLKRSAYMPSEGGLSSLCSTSPPFAAKACCKTDQRPPAVELTFWLPLCGSSAKGNTAFRMEELQLCGPTVPTPHPPAALVGMRRRLRSEHQASLPLSRSSRTVKLHYSLRLYLVIVFCTSSQFDSTPVVCDCIRDERWDFGSGAHYRHNARTIDSQKLV